MRPAALDLSTFKRTLDVPGLPLPSTIREMAEPVGAAVVEPEGELRQIATPGETVRASRILSTATGADGSVSLDAGWRVGCVVSVRRKVSSPNELTLAIHAFSRLSRWLHWSSFVLLLVAGPFLVALVPGKKDAGTFLAGPLVGALLGVAAIVVLGRMRQGTDREAVAEATERVRGAISSWADRLEAQTTASAGA